MTEAEPNKLRANDILGAQFDRKEWSKILVLLLDNDQDFAGGQARKGSF